MSKFADENDYGYSDGYSDENDYHYVEDDVDYGPLTKSEWIGTILAGLCVAITFVSVLVIIGSTVG